MDTDKNKEMAGEGVDAIHPSHKAGENQTFLRRKASKTSEPAPVRAIVAGSGTAKICPRISPDG